MVTNIIITGAPGTGKTSIINRLKQLGYVCNNEISREVISNQQQIGGRAFPWDDINEYARQVIAKMEIQYAGNRGKLVFFDRAAPDLMAYLRFRSVEMITELNNLVNYHRDTRTIVFYTPFWDNIYINDPQRPEKPEYAQQIGKTLYDTYTELGFDIIILPKTSVNNRVDFILEQIKTFEYGTDTPYNRRTAIRKELLCPEYGA
jgi:predicted ATPase